MSIPLQHSESQRSIARMAYSTLEPLHLVAYFNPYLRDALHEHQLDWRAMYVGARGGALGATTAPVVAATFYNFSPEVIAAGWEGALSHGLDAVMDLRTDQVDRTLNDTLGELVSDPTLPDLVARLRTVVEGLDPAGRALGAAWQAIPCPDQPHLALWHATAVLREWRGDGHIAALVQAGISPLQACVFHEAIHPDATVARRTMGRAQTQRSRGWSEEAWRAAAHELAERDLLVLDAETETLSDVGSQLYAAIEAATDDAAAGAWTGVADAEQLLLDARPFVKAVIESGVIPGTARKSPATPS